MIKKITVENFFSFGSKTTIELNVETNILVGINGSGKSNFIKLIRLLYESIAGDGFEKIFLKDWGGFFESANFNESQADFINVSYEFDKDLIGKAVNNEGYKFQNNPIYELTIHRIGNTGYYLEEKLYSLGIEQNKNDFIYLEFKNGKGVISTRENDEVKLQPKDKSITFKDSETVLRQISDPMRFYPHFTLKRAIENIVVYDYWDTSIDSKVRKPNVFGVENRLAANGENLAQMMNRLKNQHALQYEKIQNLLKKINPNFIDVGIDLFGSMMYLVLREKKLSKTLGARHISDGTLRFLLLLTILYNPDRGRIICIDEPEIGLHPDMINTIAEAIQLASKDSQIIVATHSPLLLNAFELEDVLIFEKNKDNHSIVCKKTEEDFHDWSGEFLVGQMWLRGLIGGKRW